MQDPSDYCRQIETYLCRKNGGHLIRIVGPAFEQVCGWASQGVPLAVAFRGIDRYCERNAAKGVRRRPVRIEFCEPDILTLFDNWRRAVGVVSRSVSDPPKKPSLASHIERVIARFEAFEPPGMQPEAFGARVRGWVDELRSLLSDAKQARGERRAAVIDRLAALDREIAQAAAAGVDEAAKQALQREAETELAPFAARMTPDARSKAVEAALERLVRESLALPIASYE